MIPENPPRFPLPLCPGDTIAVISPAGSVSPSHLEPGLKLLEEKGYRIEMAKNVYATHRLGYPYAGTEKQRQEDLQWALDHPNARAIWASRGGYGSVHSLEGLDWEKFDKNPKWYIGYSDNTAIQNLLLNRGFASIHGQTLKTPSSGVSPRTFEQLLDTLASKSLCYSLKTFEQNKTGSAEGILMGGNMALLQSLMGTKYAPYFKGRILFIEEIGEDFYALDRMLMNMDLAGVFRQIRGLVVGGMTQMGKEDENPSFQDPFDPLAYQIIQHRLKDYSFPVGYRFPNGHIFDNRPLILGAKLRLEVSDTGVKLDFYGFA